MERKLAELNRKVRTLEYAIKKSKKTTINVKVLGRQTNSIKKRIDSVNAFKKEIEGIKFTDGDSEENMQHGAKNLKRS